MALMIRLLLFSGFLSVPLVTASSHSDYTNGIVYSITSPLRNTIEFLTEVWGYCVDILCFPFTALINVFKLSVRSLEDLLSVIVDGIISLIDRLIFKPIAFILQCVYNMIDICARRPLIFITTMVARCLEKLLTFIYIGDALEHIFAYPIHKLVDLLHLAVYIVLQMPLDILFQVIIKILIAQGLKYFIFLCCFIICLLADLLNLPFIAVNVLLKGVISVPLYILLSVISAILFCCIDSVIYFFYLTVNFIKICTILFIITVSTVYVYNSSVYNREMGFTLYGIHEAACIVIRKMTYISRKILYANEDANLQALEEEDLCCAVCFEERMLPKLIPCMHANTCVNCLLKILRLGGKCPMCRSPIRNFELPEGYQMR